LALDESVNGLEKLESNGVEAYIDSGLKEFLTQYGEINIDFAERSVGGGGYLVSVGKESNCGGGCSCG
jgi:hypothetical protein